MSELLTLSKAAQLAGVNRGTLQAKIKHNELATFEGKITLTELSRVFPTLQLEDNFFNKLEKIKAEATHDKGREHETTPLTDPVALTSHLSSITQQLIKSQHALRRCHLLLETLANHLNEAKTHAPFPLNAELERLQQLIKNLL